MRVASRLRGPGDRCCGLADRASRRFQVLTPQSGGKLVPNCYVRVNHLGSPQPTGRDCCRTLIAKEFPEESASGSALRFPAGCGGNRIERGALVSGTRSVAAASMRLAVLVDNMFGHGWSVPAAGWKSGVRVELPQSAGKFDCMWERDAAAGWKNPRTSLEQVPQMGGNGSADGWRRLPHPVGRWSAPGWKVSRSGLEIIDWQRIETERDADA